MDLHEIPEFVGYSKVYTFLQQHVSMQLGDVRDMLRTPLPAVGFTHGCNFAACNALCSLISGISVSIYQPRQPTQTVKGGTRKGKKEWVGSGSAFKSLLRDHFPWSSQRSYEAEINDFFRNPLVHAVGVQEKVSCQVVINRCGPLTGPQLDELDRLGTRPAWLPATLTVTNGDVRLLVEGLYRDFLTTMQSLARDSTQMNSAEARFAKGVVIWRMGKP
jgi:hypothetical protein